MRGNFLRQSIKSKREDAGCSLGRICCNLGHFEKDVFSVSNALTKHLWKDRKETGNNNCLWGDQGTGELGTRTGACNHFPFSIFKTFFSAVFDFGIILH